MLRIEILHWAAARAEASRIRLKVFVEEQRVPREIEMDDMDAACLHALGFYRRHGFIEEGKVFEEAGIPHQEMRRVLNS